MNRSNYYEQMKALARDKRREFDFSTPHVGLSDLRKIYAKEGIKIDLWDHKLRALRGAYFSDELGTTVMISRNLPNDPRAFTMAHELKHHFVDQGLTLSYCDKSNELEVVEIGAEVFAAELLFPEQDFVDRLHGNGVYPNSFSPNDIVRLKRETKTTLSYTGLAKYAERLGFAGKGSLAKVRWKKLEESIYGIPFYKRRHKAVARK